MNTRPPKFQLLVSPPASRPGTPAFEEKHDQTEDLVEASLPAGCQPDHVYKSMMSPRVYSLRQRFIASLEREIPWLVEIQSTTRHRYLDVYFHLASLLGTHSSFLIFLPLFFWFGLPEVGFNLLFILGVGIASTSILKDLLCVPRPFAPPVARFTLVGSHAKEYGWPSTHSTNAVNVALICASTVGPTGKVLLAIYAASVVLGRIYSGMHSMVDCCSGVLIAYLQHVLLVPLAPKMVLLCRQGYVIAGPLVIAVVLSLVTLHPQPVDPCPCFEDTVAMISVVQGCLIGHWLLGLSGITRFPPPQHFIGQSFHIAIALTCAKIFVGISILLIWRILVKQILHHVLPSTIRVLKPYLALPRRFYEPSNSYEESYSKTDPPENMLLHSVPSLIDLSSPEGVATSFSTGLDAQPIRNGSTLKSRRTQEDAGKVEAGGNSSTSAPAEASQQKRYDADVLTKIVVYSGIGLLACLGIPFGFEAIEAYLVIV